MRLVLAVWLTKALVALDCAPTASRRACGAVMQGMGALKEDASTRLAFSRFVGAEATKENGHIREDAAANETR